MTKFKSGRPPKKQKKLKGRKPSAYNKHVARMMKGGKATMKQAAAAWKRRGKGRAARSATRAAPKRRAAPTRRAAPSRAKGVKKRVAGINQQKVFKYVRIAALLGPALFEAMGSGSAQDKASRIMAAYTGYSPQAGRFDWANLAKGYSPILAATLVTYGIPKLAGLLRGA